eukprot:CAMPEP_0119081674 /NCGR_PEP_ID=MMETSP1178-20130426/117902_1 /TAXON_ID=33656 /ORGANISM="unid sp, Strain CCMP2000" /LENGTH=40 /DNA_ID= /DNA_START= /DNA_END= /DNA_ORIENTATION=
MMQMFIQDDVPSCIDRTTSMVWQPSTATAATIYTATADAT